MERTQLEFSIQEAGCLIYVADRHLGGHPFSEFHEFFGGRSGLRDLTLGGAVMAASLYQDDGYNVRVVFGDLTENENDQWTSRIDWKLDLSSGQMTVSGVCDEGLADHMKEWPFAEDGGDYELGAFIQVTPGQYAVSIYGFPPNDLAGGWMRLENKGLFREAFGRDAGIEFEKPVDYFKRTRPGETPRDWITEGWEDANFLDFIIQLRPMDGDLLQPEFEEDGCLKWKFRKPTMCPTGIEFQG